MMILLFCLLTKLTLNMKDYLYSMYPVRFAVKLLNDDRKTAVPASFLVQQKQLHVYQVYYIPYASDFRFLSYISVGVIGLLPRMLLGKFHKFELKKNSAAVSTLLL